jgi:hypothetical protein
LALSSLPFGVIDRSAYVDATDERLQIRFGPWVIETPMANVEGAERTGPYNWWKVAGPPHLSFKDLGLTFATTDEDGVCLRFKEPVRALPIGPLRHRAVTVTVDDPEELLHFIEQNQQ